MKVACQEGGDSWIETGGCPGCFLQGQFSVKGKAWPPRGGGADVCRPPGQPLVRVAKGLIC